MNDCQDIVIVGAGPAGIRAAETLVKSGLSPIVIDEGHRCGGQIYRQSFIGDIRNKTDIYGDQTKKADRLHKIFEDIIPFIKYRPQTNVWHLFDKQLHLSYNGKQETLAFKKLILATGATDRVLPFKGWTLPGVYTLGAAQTALKSQATLVGDEIVFMGSSPLLYLVAYQYLKAGAKVKAMLDTAPFSAKLNLMIAAMYDFPTIRRGLSYGVKLKAAGVKIVNGVEKLEALGKEQLSAIIYTKGKKTKTIPCNALAYNFGLRSEVQLADLAGLDFSFHKENRAWLPKSSIDTRTSHDDIYIAGDGAEIEGADGAELSGEIAALSLIQDIQKNINKARLNELLKQRLALRKARKYFNKAFPFPVDWMSKQPDDLIVCRCEEISIADICQKQDFYNQWEVNRSKAVSRVGMGRCQGRMCGVALSELLCRDHNCPIEDIGRLRAQPPIKPLSIKVAGEQR